EVSLSQSYRRLCQGFHRPGYQLGQDEPAEYSESRENACSYDELADLAARRGIDRCRRQERLDESDGLTRRGKDRNAGGVEALGVDALNCGAAVGETCRIERSEGVDRIVRERAVVDDLDFQTHPLAQRS